MREHNRLPTRARIRERLNLPDTEPADDPPAWMRALLLAGVLAVVVALLLRDAGWV